MFLISYDFLLHIVLYYSSHDFSLHMISFFHTVSYFTGFFLLGMVLNSIPHDTARVDRSVKKLTAETGEEKHAAGERNDRAAKKPVQK